MPGTAINCIETPLEISCFQISPLDIVRAPNPDSLKVMGEKFVAEHLGKESQGTETWKMEINSRNMSDTIITSNTNTI